MSKSIFSFINKFTAVLFAISCSIILFSCSNNNSASPSVNISTIKPTKGEVGSSVTINGSGFNSQEKTENLVYFNGTEAEVTKASANKLITKVPPNASSGHIKVVTFGKTAEGPIFTIITSGPSIASITPDSGKIGAKITIEGYHFSPTPQNNKVTFNGTVAIVMNATQTKLTVEVPSAARSGDVKVTVNGKPSNDKYFKVIAKNQGKEKIVYNSNNQDDNNEIYMINPDGSGKKRLTNNPSKDNEPDISPDGKRIVFRSERTGNGDIYIMDVNGNNMTQITKGPKDDANPSWSPDGKKIAFDRKVNGNNNDIFIIDATGKNEKRLTNDPDHTDGYPSWSPDGKKIAFNSRRESEKINIFMMEQNGNNIQQITTGQGENLYESWAPNSSRIVFLSKRGTNSQLFTIKANGKDEKQITSSSDASLKIFAKWSPDGSEVAYMSTKDGTQGIWRINANGNASPKQVTTGNKNERHLSWGIIHPQ